MSVTKAQLVQPVGIFTAPGVNVSGVLTASSFSGNLTGTVTGLTTTANITVGVLTATSFFGSGANLTGIPAGAYTGQNVTSVSGITTIDLSAGNVIYFTHDTNTTVAFANTSTTTEVRFIRTKDDTLTERTITWPDGFIWDGGSAPVLGLSTSASDATIINLTTRDAGVTWYGYVEFSNNPAVELWSWGRNEFGQVGQNNTTEYSSPVQIPGITWSSIVTGSQHSLATKTDGTLWAWGRNFYGNLGQNNITNYSSPRQIPGTTWSSISGGNFLSFAFKTDGTLWSWGDNSKGQLAQNNTTRYSSPVQIPGTTWSSISAGGFHSLATKTDGTLWSWGYGVNGRLGQNNTTDISSPVQIPGTTWSSISGGSEHSLATKTDGTLWSWGLNQFGQLGQNNITNLSSPVQIPGTTWSSISATKSGFSLAIKTDGTLWSWGNNFDGRLGQNNTIRYSSPVQIPGNTWSSISGGNGNAPSLATKTDGTLWSWGSFSYGQLGQNNTTSYSSPVQIPGTQWSSISISNHSLALQVTY
jgi:alpha-tubulin suppressor-like RCC1 family protein